MRYFPNVLFQHGGHGVGDEEEHHSTPRRAYLVWDASPITDTKETVEENSRLIKERGIPLARVLYSGEEQNRPPHGSPSSAGGSASGESFFGPTLSDDQRNQVDLNEWQRKLGKLGDPDEMFKKMVAEGEQFVRDSGASERQSMDELLKELADEQLQKLNEALEQNKGLKGTEKDPNDPRRKNDPSDPCADFISKAAPPPPFQQPGDNLIHDSKYSDDPALREQWEQLKTERYLAQEMSSGSGGWTPHDKNIFKEDIEHAMNDMGMSPKDAVKYALIYELGQASASQLHLDDDFVDILYKAFTNPDPNAVDWQGLADYIQAKADCDGKRMQKAVIDKNMNDNGRPGKVGSGCSDETQKEYDQLAKQCKDCQDQLKNKPKGVGIPRRILTSRDATYTHPPDTTTDMSLQGPMYNWTYNGPKLRTFGHTPVGSPSTQDATRYSTPGLRDTNSFTEAPLLDSGWELDNTLIALEGITNLPRKIMMGLFAALAYFSSAKGKFQDFNPDLFQGVSDAMKEEMIEMLYRTLPNIHRQDLPDWRQQEYDYLQKLKNYLDEWFAQTNGHPYP